MSQTHTMNLHVSYKDSRRKKKQFSFFQDKFVTHGAHICKNIDSQSSCLIVGSEMGRTNLQQPFICELGIILAKCEIQ